MNNIKRILVTGYGRAGKDTSGVLLSAISGIPYAASTSWAAKEYVAKKLGIHPMVAWDTRHARREEWKAICDRFRENDQTVLMRLALAGVNEEQSSGLISGWKGIVTGARDRAEFRAAVVEDLFDSFLWIENPRVPEDFTVTFTRDEVVNAGGDVIDNDGTLDQLRSKLFVWAEARGLVPGLYLSSKCPTSDIYRE